MVSRVDWGDVTVILAIVFLGSWVLIGGAFWLIASLDVKKRQKRRREYLRRRWRRGEETNSE